MQPASSQAFDFLGGALLAEVLAALEGSLPGARSLAGFLSLLAGRPLQQLSVVDLCSCKRSQLG